VRRSLSRHALLTLVRALIVSKVDYCNSVLAGIPSQLQDRLQSVLNVAARLVFSARRSERITPLLRELNWFRVPERVTFRLCVLVYRCLRGTAPAYLAKSLHRTSDDWVVTLAIWGKVTPGVILTKCGLWGDIVDVITCAIFCNCGCGCGERSKFAASPLQHWSHYRVSV